MTKTNPVERDTTYQRRRIEHLEQVNRETLEALKQIAELADLKTSINNISDVSIILSKADKRLRQLLDLDVSAFFTFNLEGLELELAFVNDESARDRVEHLFQTLVDSMHVARCINGTRPVFASPENGRTAIVMHPLTTSSRVRGLFLATLKTQKQHIPDATLAVSSVILGNTASMLESFELYGMIRDMNIELEDQVNELARNQERLEKEVSLRKNIEANLRDSRIMLETVMENIPQHVFWKDPDLAYMGCNRNFAAAAGLESTDDIIGLTDHDLPWTDDEAAFFRKVDREIMKKKAPIIDLVETITMNDGEERFVETNKIPLSDDNGAIIGILGTFQDVTDRKKYQEELAHQAFHDSLTDLPNRALIIERIDRAIHRFKRSPENGFAVMLLDLDRFKYINDSLGHHAGDRLLTELADRLSKTLRSLDTVARLGGDEFAILIEDLNTAREMVRVLRRIMEIIQKPYDIHGSTIHSTASIGVVLGNDGYDSAETILRDADTAMYAVKNRGGGAFKVFTASMRDKVMKTATLQNDLVSGLTRNEFFLEYQPIYNLSGQEFMGVEALLRWEHPERGRMSPGEFIPIAEDTGHIVELGSRILNQACEQAAFWRSLTSAPFYVSVNISGKQLVNTTFINKVRNALTNANLPPECLALEVTETVLMEQADTALTILRQVRDMGVRIFLDDFGTGYSSLSYLQQFPVDTIKIDRCFVTPLRDGKGSNDAIIKAIMALGRSLGMKVIAEGVEEECQLAHLAGLDCKQVQGYYFDRPLPHTEIEKRLPILDH